MLNNTLYDQKSFIAITKNEKSIASIHRFNIISRLLFYLFLFSLPFESVLVSMGYFSLSSANSIWSLSRLSGLLMIIGFVISIKPIKSLRLLPVWGFIIYAFSYFAAAIVVSNVSNLDITFGLFSFPWFILIFIIACEFFMDPTARSQGIKILMIAIGLCGFFQVINLAISTGVPMTWGSSNMRISAFGEDQNFIGAQYAVGILIAILIILNIIPSKKFTKLISLFAIGICLVALIQTGSRSAVICNVLALIALLLNRESTKKRMKIWMAFILLVGLLTALIISDQSFLQRYIDTVRYGDISGRSSIYKAAFNMFLNSPIVGYGPLRNTELLGAILGVSNSDTHNVLLWVLTASGIVGFLPFFFGYIMCLVQAIKSRAGADSVAPLVLCVMTISFSQTAGWQGEKLFWVLLAYAATAVI